MTERKSAPAKRAQGQKLRLMRESDRVRAAGMARLYFEGRATGEELARALQILAVRGTFDTEFPGPRTLAREIAEFDEPSRAWRLTPSAAATKRKKYDFIRGRYQWLLANGTSPADAKVAISDEGMVDWRRCNQLLRERLAHIDWTRFKADQSARFDRIPLPVDEPGSKRYVRALQDVSARCAEEYGIAQIRRRTTAECTAPISIDTVERAIAELAGRPSAK
jgi:hypothetical protein